MMTSSNCPFSLFFLLIGKSFEECFTVHMPYDDVIKGTFFLKFPFIGKFLIPCFAAGCTFHFRMREIRAFLDAKSLTAYEKLLQEEELRNVWKVIGIFLFLDSTTFFSRKKLLWKEICSLYKNLLTFLGHFLTKKGKSLINSFLLSFFRQILKICIDVHFVSTEWSLTTNRNISSTVHLAKK